MSTDKKLNLFSHRLSFWDQCKILVNWLPTPPLKPTFCQKEEFRIKVIP